MTNNKLRGSFSDYNSVPQAIFAGKDTVLYQADNEVIGF